MLKGPKLTQAQWKYLTGGFSSVSIAIIIFSLAAIFVPETVNLSGELPQAKAIFYLTSGLILFAIGAIISRRAK